MHFAVFSRADAPVMRRTFLTRIGPFSVASVSSVVKTLLTLTFFVPS